MKYEIKFINPDTVPGCNRDTIRIFGQDDIKAVAEHCFELGKSGVYSHIEFKRVEKDSRKTQRL